MVTTDYELCTSCNIQFQLTAQEIDFYRRIEVPQPQRCPDCRQKLRLAWRNERYLYRRRSALSGKPTIAFYHEDSPYTVYSQEEWWSDRWDGKAYGTEYQPHRPFFEQLGELIAKIPQMAILISHGENSDYCPYSVYYKNSYMCISGYEGENCYYGYQVIRSRDCADCSVLYESELCYECTYSLKLYNSLYCHECESSSDLAFSTDCIGCDHCIGCFGLRRKSYHLFNEPCSKETYAQTLSAILHSYERSRQFLDEHKKFCVDKTHRPFKIVNCENSSGDYLWNCKNTIQSFVCRELEDGGYCWNIPVRAKDLYDANYSPSEFTYNVLSVVNGYNAIASVFSWDVSDVAYCFQCFYGNHLLGCAGLKHSSYCILNKQYGHDDYETLRKKIREELLSQGLWGEFLPAKLSPFGYNETIAQDYFPLTPAEAARQGFHWSVEHLSPTGPPATYTPHGSIEEVPDTIVDEVLSCVDSGRGFRIIPQELTFYRSFKLPIPTKSPEQRYRERMSRENSRKVFRRACPKCSAEFLSTFPLQSPERVFCNNCYLMERY